MKTSTTLMIAAAAAAIGVGAGMLWSPRAADVVAHANGTGVAGAGAQGASAPKARKLLYYRNAMGLPDTSPVPKKDPMGMDYVAVYEGEDDETQSAGANAIRISPDKVQKIGVRVDKAAMRTLGQIVRASGRVEPDERHQYAIAPKFEGYVERLHVNITGQPVTRGQPLFEVYSPEMVSAQREYAIAAQGMRALSGASETAQAGMKQLAESSLVRMRYWDLPQEQIDALVKTGTARRTITFRSPVAGIVTEKKALQGYRFMPGETLYQVVDLSSVWVVADVFEQDIGLVKAGAKANVKVASYPGESFTGRITYVYPTLNPQTRTVPVRIELSNPHQRLKLAMYVQVELPVGSKTAVLTVPDSAVIDSGTRRLVLVQRGEGRFEPREVKLGARSDNYVQVLEGLREGEDVVIAANFLIDAESNLKAAVGGLGGHSGHGAPAKGAEGAPKPQEHSGHGAPAAASSPEHAGHDTAPAASAQEHSGHGAPAPTSAGHKAEGKVEGIDAKAGTLSLNHGAVQSLKWPAMTMEFKVANAGLLQGLKPGAAVSVEFVERQRGEWVITSVVPSAKPAAGHSGH